MIEPDRVIRHVVSDIFLRYFILSLVKDFLDKLDACFISRIIESRLVPSDPFLNLVRLRHFVTVLLRQVSLGFAKNVGTV